MGITNIPPGTLNDFLWYGYVPRSDITLLEEILNDSHEFNALQKFLHELSTNELVREGAHILRQVFKSHLSARRGPHIIPLSGGLDSRLILAALLEEGCRNEIEAVSFGVDGALDYEIPKRIAKMAGVKHSQINLNSLTMTVDNLRFAYASGAAWTELITAFFNHNIKKLYGDRSVYWSGFLGGEIAGGHYSTRQDDMTWIESLCSFARSNKRSSNSIYPQQNSTYNPISSLPPKPYKLDHSTVGYYEQIDYSVRQASWIKKAVVGNFNNVISPFTDARWTRFMSAIPRSLRIGCSLYHQIAMHSYPRLFRVRTKTEPFYLTSSRARGFIQRIPPYLSRLQNKVRPNGSTSHSTLLLNYIDFNEAFRHRDDYIELARFAISQLDNTHVAEWLKPLDILNEHLSGSEDLGDDILLLTSLGANIYFDEQKSVEHNRYGS
jgi:hypothetical protein